MKKENIDEKEVKNAENAENPVTDTKDQSENGKQPEASVDDNQSEKDQEGEEMTDVEKEIAQLKDDVAENKDKYLRLYSEFENFRRRTAKEKLDMVQTANSELLADLLPVLDDFERALKNFDDKKSDLSAVKDGIKLIHNKFSKVLEQKGLKPMNSKEGMDFDPELHEAITQIPAPKPKLKGKVVDVIEKGYLLKDKVIRYAKVVIGS